MCFVERERQRKWESEKARIMAEAKQLTELVQSLEQATLMAKQFFTTADPSHLHHIYSSLHHAHHRLSSFLSLPSPPPPPPPPPPEPMQVGDEGGDETEVTSKDPVDKVGERMKNCYIQNKRRKRPLSPSSATEPTKYAAQIPGFDTRESRLRSLDLVYQFHAWETTEGKKTGRSKTGECSKYRHCFSTSEFRRIKLSIDSSIDLSLDYCNNNWVQLVFSWLYNTLIGWEYINPDWDDCIVIPYSE